MFCTKFNLCVSHFVVPWVRIGLLQSLFVTSIAVVTAHGNSGIL